MKKTNTTICYMIRFSTPTSSGSAIFDSKLELQQYLMREGFITTDFKPLQSVNCAKIEYHNDNRYCRGVVIGRWDYGMPDSFRF